MMTWLPRREVRAPRRGKIQLKSPDPFSLRPRAAWELDTWEFDTWELDTWEFGTWEFENLIKEIQAKEMNCDCVSFAFKKESAGDMFDWPKIDGARQGAVAVAVRGARCLAY
jgi:hypothetical protein